MKLADLIAYAKEKYNISEDHKWADFPGFSVLADPVTKKWAALIMRKKNDKTGEVLEACDIKYPSDNITAYSYLRQPFRMHGKNWTGVKFGEYADPNVVLRLFDKAVAQLEKDSKQKNAGGYKIVLDNSAKNEKNAFHDTAIPKLYTKPRVNVMRELKAQPEEISPPKIIELRKMIKEDAYNPRENYADYVSNRAKNFYKQAKFMEDYEDDAKWKGSFFNYYPTYELLNNKQLRGYFGWRTQVRKGNFPYIPPSAAYIYIYELLNGVGADTEEDALKKLEEFEKGYLKDNGDVAYLRENLKRWKFEYCIVNNLPLELALKYADSKKIKKDHALYVLKNPDNFSNKEVLDALLMYAEKARENSPALTANEEAAQRIFADSWRNALSFKQDGKSLFTLCFGKKIRRRAYPLYNAVYYNKLNSEKFTYEIDGNRKYDFDGNSWYLTAYDRIYFDRNLFRGFLHETDLKLRRYLKTGRYLKGKADEAWADPYIHEAIEKLEKEKIEKARPKISIRASDLEKIRRDAALTRESLLTDEERGINGFYQTNNMVENTSAAASNTVELFDDEEPYKNEYTDVLNDTQKAILKDLLNGGTADGILQQSHLMPTIAADEINEALFYEIGDNAIDSDGDNLYIIDDYREDIERIAGGFNND